MTDFPESFLEFGVFDWIEYSETPAADIFEQRLRLAEAADAAGFWGWHIAEHQGTPLSMDISPSVVLAAAIQRTRRLRLGPLVYCLPWYNPYRLYNEVCMLDQMSRGRLELGVGRGISPIESAYYGIASVQESRERYREALDIFMTACRSDVLDYEGTYYSYSGLELYNHPYQQPYPPLWFPSSDRASIEFTASHGYHTVLNSNVGDVSGLYQQYREVWVRHKDEPGRHNGHVAAPKLGASRHIVIADTDAEARSLAGSAMSVWRDHITYLTRRHGLPDQPSNPATRTPVEARPFFAGAPKTVAQELSEFVKQSGINYLMLVFAFGDLRPDHCLHSLQLFADQVMPAVRESVDQAAAASDV